MVGFGMLLFCYMSNMVGGGKKIMRINIVMGGRFCIKEEESKWFSSCKMGTYVKDPFLDSYYS